MDRITVRPACVDDLDEIFAMRDAYYGARVAPVQTRDGIYWMVAVLDETPVAKGKVLACQASFDEPSLHQRWQSDLYRLPGRYGTLALYKLMDVVHEQAQKAGLDLNGFTEPDNIENLSAALQKGWQVTGILITRYRTDQQKSANLEAPCLE